MKNFLKGISYDDRNLLAIGLAFISNLIFLNITEREEGLNNIFEIFNLNVVEALKEVFILFFTFIAIIFLIFAMIISINIILHSLEVFNKIVSLGTIIVICIIAFYGLNNSIKGFKILFLTLFFVGLFFKIWEEVKNNK
ncbi:zinc ABC transporter ATPase [Clostridium perfringens]|uniref:zinc ABC transporter ATPase n=1 Tax=Clostridium perfringens TaxID=1502 RepID=UPI001D514DBA|nr:zinc ABC transporter ATPase [Clostridium perfringens]MDK0685512.1 zinc ABC transporter ATPase [Clostridium perfringens]MDM0493821.1 zinc ABC transporter ATPase [Clostridium perfringens]MDM0496329.1 zinc ABC transporter ATPase [Clostridium perfringens]